VSETICGYEPLESKFFDAEVELRQLVIFWGSTNGFILIR